MSTIPWALRGAADNERVTIALNLIVQRDA
jgi:hypothetical protein